MTLVEQLAAFMAGIVCPKCGSKDITLRFRLDAPYHVKLCCVAGGHAWNRNAGGEP